MSETLFLPEKNMESFKGFLVQENIDAKYNFLNGPVDKTLDELKSEYNCLVKNTCLCSSDYDDDMEIVYFDYRKSVIRALYALALSDKEGFRMPKFPEEVFCGAYPLCFSTSVLDGWADNILRGGCLEERVSQADKIN